ncbi:MAG: galactonate dehydratase [Deltaproteobacteria bacterium SG8_13]|nr:MAG: galactonate dehydratase [Deltaproteobacteria bacterium SG8_13]
MTSDKPKTIRLHPDDNVVVARVDMAPGDRFGNQDLCCKDPIPAGHKVAVRAISAGRAIIKYGQIIGFASVAIQPGEQVHTHNVALKDFSRETAIGCDAAPARGAVGSQTASFSGIVRPDGTVATRNYVAILPTVNCSAGVARFIADGVAGELRSRYPNIDGVVALVHQSGCCSPGDSEGLQILQRTLAGYARHPNFGAVLVIGLGCEVNQVECLMANMGLAENQRLKTLDIQSTGGTRATVEKGIALIGKMLPEADRVQRQPVPASHILLGLECGGSDAYSGISANPALGAAVDLLVGSGGTAILSETPEIYGAEHLLTRRSERPEVGEKLLRRIRWWEKHTARLESAIDNNPTPGNKAGGITTIMEKSLGAVAKAGSTNLVEVYQYAEPVTEKGLVFMDTPGYDPASVTGMVAGGANVICFTTGRGTVYGVKPVPTLKLASNSSMYRRLADDMDVNCGVIIDGDRSVEELGELIFRQILETASGRKTRSEQHGFGDCEFVPWHIGAIL